MNRVKTKPIVLRSLCIVLTLAVLGGAAAQQNRLSPPASRTPAQHTVRTPAASASTTARTTPTTAKASRAVGSGGGGGGGGIHPPFISPGLDQVPAWVLRRSPSGSPILRKGMRLPKTTRAPGDQGVVRQTLLLTKADPTQNFSTFPAPSENEHPAWAANGQSIYFDSNRASTGVDSLPGPYFNIFSMAPDGTGVTQVVPGTVNQIEPSNSNLTLVFVAGGTLNFATGLTTPTSNGFNLYSLDLTNVAAGATQVTDLQNSPVNFSDVRRPSIAPGSQAVVFAGRLVGQNVYHIWQYTFGTAQYAQLTKGASNDTSPAYSPDGNSIAYTSNASAFGKGGVATGVFPDGHTEIYTTSSNPLLQAVPFRITNFSAGGVASSNRNPSWGPIGIAFASTRVDSANNGIANAVGTTTDIYYVTNPTLLESKGNPALKLQTSEPDTAIDPNDPTFMFDPNHTSNEDYPSVPPATISTALLPRIAFESDRVTPPVNQTNGLPSGPNLEIYAAAEYDIDAPSLLKFDQGTNDIVNVQLETGVASSAGLQARQFGAGQTVRIAVRVSDYQTGVKYVFVQIKCPNAQERSPDSLEHKIFYAGGAALGGTNIAINWPFELDYQAVDAQHSAAGKPARFKHAGSNSNVYPIPGTWPGGNLYIPGFDDFTAWSGNEAPPDVATTNPPPVDGNGGCWLQLYDDGSASSGGHEPPGETAGDGIYTGTFTTPSNLPSDWVIDVIAYDNALNPDQGAPNKSSNWIIYDNVWGFSTLPFAVTSQCLYVDEYDSGQKFTTGRVGSAVPGFPITAIPTESYMTELDPALFPTLYQTGTPPKIGPLLNYSTTLGAYSYLGDCHPINQNYDIWRIQCRGPLPQSVLNQYLPHTQNQPGITNPVVIAESCVIWHSPYTGDMFVGPGTILDPSTQSMLAAYVASAGRLFTTGQDIAWGLTLGGSIPNQFLSNTMKVNYVSNTWFNPYGVYVGGQNSIALSGAGRGAAPIAWETWYSAVGCWHDDFLPLQTTIPEDWPPGQAGPIILFDTSPTAPYTAGANNQGTPNDIAFPVNAAVTGPTADVLGIDATSSGNTPVICWYSDPTVNSHIVYSAIGFEGINPDSKVPPGATGSPPPLVLNNKRMELEHNILDYLRTGRLVGQVFVINGNGGANQPLAGALLTAQDGHTNKIVGAAVTASDGSYSIAGLPPDGAYLVSAIKAGYVTQHLRIDAFHGSSYDQTDFYTTLAPPGTITGKITVAGSNVPVGGAIVAATDVSNPNNPNPPVFTGTSDPATGIYTISVPNSTYTLTVTNVAALGYAASIPPSIPNLVVAPSQLVSNQNFALQLKPGSASGKVDIATVTGADTGTPLPGAVVTLTTTVNGVAVNYASAPTASNGTYTIPNLPPGTYGAVAARSGYQTSASVSVTIVTQQNTVLPTFALVPIPPGSISGLVATSTNVPVSGAAIQVVDSTGTALPVVYTGAPTTVGNYTYNYTVTNVPAGATVSVTATKPGYTPTPNPDTQTVPITSGQQAQNINFTLNPLYQFNNTLTLVSMPYYFTTTGTPSGPPLDVATLLGVPQADIADGAFAFVTWNAATQAYVYYPTPPADTFHLGVGYFMQDTDPAVSLALTNPNGIPAPEDASGNYLPYNIPLQTGWNLIGMPYTYSVDFTSLQVQVGTTLINVPTAQTGTNPILGSALWTYANGSYQVVYTLDPFRGYWLRAYQPATLIVTPSAATGRGASVAANRPLQFSNTTHSDWMLDLMASAGTQTKSKATLGMRQSATDGYDIYKLEAAPAATKQNVNLTFDHTDWVQKSGSYAVDLRSPSANSWNFTVRSNIANTPVTLTWPSIASSGRHTLTLTDLDAQTSFELHNRSSYTIAASSTPLTRHFLLQVSGATRPALNITDLRANMLGGRATGGVAGITYTLTDQASVQVSVLQNGRRVRTLTNGDSRAAGPVTVTWDLKNDQGVAMPTNVYTIEVRAVGSDGHVAHQERPLVVTR